jgi:hypothetical protein
MDIADSMEVRIELVRRVKAGEMTLKAAQAELRRITRKAKDSGKPTYFQSLARRSHQEDGS